MNKLRMAHPTREKERSLLHVLEFERKLKETESNLKAVLYELRNAMTEMNKLKMGHAEIMAMLEELKIETHRLVEELDENMAAQAQLMGMPHKRCKIFCFMTRVTAQNDLWLHILLLFWVNALFILLTVS